MSLDKILAISGKPGLYELKTQTRSGFVAESLLDGKRITVGLRNNVSLLSEIAVYTLKEEVPLREVFGKIKEKENGAQTSVGHKEDKSRLEEYFFEVLPDYDEDRVYLGDIKKIIQWYNLLQAKGMTDFDAAEETPSGDTEEKGEDTPDEA
ncbi:DUF5606 family protein [Sinomicrobium soli]|uniref:DUF5606 family protein n=1 Tax=Sinomicrobium sp. N-1-3-6 TaxID=2219864 RepID=UPI000DCDE22B|nr:DUF5606 domain-containing protein [Sinomicrobium sp. N-1-3-6]RAV29781.1 hypothetical protein DN748_06605 [Sinomicrobium sp. N-1-3-6]